MSIVTEKLALLPDKPGCYLMKDEDGKIIYVGKAKNLKNRVKSYFTGPHNAKTTKLVSLIRDFDYILTASELESLVLEINLIKKHDPRFNIMLTDDKTYPYIALSNETHPRLYITRNPKRKGMARYWGPYPNVSAARHTVDLLNRVYPLRKCLNIPKKECMYYHIHNCFGPCINKEIPSYNETKNAINSFLNGDNTIIVKDLEAKMTLAANENRFELAIEYRDLIRDIKSTTAKQKIEINDLQARDFIGVYHTDDELSVHILMMRNGAIVQNYHSITSYINDPEEAIISYLLQYYQNSEIAPKEIAIDNFGNFEVLSEALNILVVLPQKGKKREILDMANTNAKNDMDIKNAIYKTRVLSKIETVEELGKILGIKAPYHIEAFDNSNLYGEYPVSAMVVYKNGVPSKKDYRKYKVETVVGANDYETMKEVVYRRYRRLLLEDQEMPDLIVMDGGMIQVNACLEIIRALNLAIPVMGIQKDDNHKATILYFNEKFITIDKHSPVFLLLANISQTVHDYAITFFRSKKLKGLFSSRLDGIPGVGPTKKQKIITYFVTIEKMRLGTIEEYKALGINENLRDEIIKHLEN